MVWRFINNNFGVLSMCDRCYGKLPLWWGHHLLVELLILFVLLCIWEDAFGQILLVWIENWDLLLFWLIVFLILLICTNEVERVILKVWIIVVDVKYSSLVVVQALLKVIQVIAFVKVAVRSLPLYLLHLLDFGVLRWLDTRECSDEIVQADFLYFIILLFLLYRYEGVDFLRLQEIVHLLIQLLRWMSCSFGVASFLRWAKISHTSALLLICIVFFIVVFKILIILAVLTAFAASIRTLFYSLLLYNMLTICKGSLEILHLICYLILQVLLRIR